METERKLKEVYCVAYSSNGPRPPSPYGHQCPHSSDFCQRSKQAWHEQKKRMHNRGTVPVFCVPCTRASTGSTQQAEKALTGF